jgi:hypothetical protein
MKYLKLIFPFLTLFTFSILLLPGLAIATEMEPTRGPNGYYEKLDIETPGEQVLRLYGEELTPKLIEKVLNKPMSELDPKMFLSGKPLSSLDGKPVFLSEKLRSSLSDKSALLAGSGDRNTLDLSDFRAGDMVVARDSSCSFFIVSCYWSHAATFDSGYYLGNETDFAFWSAYPTGAAPSDNSSSPYSVSGRVGRQSVDSIHDYSSTSGMTVPTVSDTDAYDVTTYIYNQRAENYYTLTSKSTSSNWYCSKLPYRGYYVEAAGKTLDYDGGYYVLPDDIYMDPEVNIFETGS